MELKFTRGDFILNKDYLEVIEIYGHTMHGDKYICRPIIDTSQKLDGGTYLIRRDWAETNFIKIDSKKLDTLKVLYGK